MWDAWRRWLQLDVKTLGDFSIFYAEEQEEAAHNDLVVGGEGWLAGQSGGWSGHPDNVAQRQSLKVCFPLKGASQAVLPSRREEH